ncbi:patatin-like phospholipase family protein [Eudoraea sp.]|uniref:patatin-like phospholipase family protein n=1 Tax=Eudoraea sp. TaxID=1979955 RepID=UPI003C75B66B
MSRKHLKVILLVLLIGLPPFLSAQEKKPKVVVVLSGGGAKGIAHIPFIQLLDSLGIVPDLVVGTSMGSIVGGLYAMGYSGDSIANIALNVNWNQLLREKVALSDVSMEEKSEFKRYLAQFDLTNGKPKINSSLLGDQNLREFLSVLTYPVYRINDFDKLPIPYRAVATDIVNGKEVVIKEGSLAMAMRSSMSIPGVFKPVPYNNTLLVDGGILDNFPTDIAKKMGADIILGSDVGGGMAPIEKLDNIGTILFQTGMLASNLKNPENRELCDILIDHIPNLSYSTGDFAKSQEIYEEGKIAVKNNMKELADLAEQLKDYPLKKHELPQTKDRTVFDTIIYKGISRANLDLVKARTNIKPHVAYTTEDVKNGIDRAMGTEIFSEINYKAIVNGDSTGFEIEGLEKSRHQAKTSLHYDDYRGVGLILNYTGRNIIGKASRFLVSLDIAEQPMLRLQYQKNFGSLKDWWWRSEAFAQQLRQRFYINGETADDFRYRHFLFDNQINKNLNSLRSYLGIGVNYKYSKIQPKVDPEISENVLLLNEYFSNSLEVYTQYLYNSLNDVFFPTEGAFFNVNIRRSLLNNVDLSYSDDNLEDASGKTNGFTKFNLTYEKRVPFQLKITGIFSASAGFIFEDQPGANTISFTDYGYSSKYFLGGNMVIPNKESYTFSGLHEAELNINQFMKLNIGLQLNPFEKLYVTPHFNIASVGFENFDEYIKDAFSPDGKWSDAIETSTLISAGARFSYNSILGPVNFDVSWVNDINKVRLTFSVGIPFNRSN